MRMESFCFLATSKTTLSLCGVSVIAFNQGILREEEGEKNQKIGGATSSVHHLAVYQDYCQNDFESLKTLKTFGKWFL